MRQNSQNMDAGSIRNSQSGSVLLTVLIVATLTAMILIGVGSLSFSTLKAKLGQASKGALRDAIFNFETCILDGPSWALSLGDASLTNDFTVDTKKKLRLLVPSAPDGMANLCGSVRDSTTGALIGLAYDSNVSTMGFTPDGGVCNTYADAGNDACPYHFDFYRVVSCGGASNCSAPTETGLITIKFHPKTGGKFLPLKLGDGFARPGGDQTIAITRQGPSRRQALTWASVPLYPTSAGISPVDVVNTLARQVQAAGSKLPLVFLEVEPTGSGGGDATACAAPGGILRNLNTLQSDPGLLASLSSANITLTTGIYECSISVPGFMVGHFHAVLQPVGTTGAEVVLGSDAFSPSYGSLVQARSEGTGRFTVNGSATLEVREFCTDAPTNPNPNPSGFLIQNLGLGFPSGTASAAAPDIYTVVNCSTYYGGI